MKVRLDSLLKEMHSKERELSQAQEQIETLDHQLKVSNEWERSETSICPSDHHLSISRSIVFAYNSFLTPSRSNDQ